MTMSLADDFDLFHWQATIFGPVNLENFTPNNHLSQEKTVYEGGIFHLDIKIPENYPFVPPKYIFTTKILHPNIDAEGRISHDMFEQYWCAAFTLSKGSVEVIFKHNFFRVNCNRRITKISKF